MEIAELQSRYQSSVRQVRSRLTGHVPLSMQEQLEAIRIEALAYTEQDRYGGGELIESFTREMAELLGKTAAVFLPSGTMAQSIALRVWADRAQNSHVAFHATSHLELHEQHGYEALYGLRATILGDAESTVTLDNLLAVTEPLAAVLLELPMREIGGQLPAWEELLAQSNWARENGIALHMDGARLWQCTPHYNRSMADIASLFDSVYLSFYKDIGGIAGSILAGPQDFIEEAKTWIHRAGGNLYSLFPYVLAARAGLARNLAQIPTAVEDAAWLARAFNQIESANTRPALPPTNLFHLLLPDKPQQLLQKAYEWVENTGVMVMPMPRENPAGGSIIEFNVGSAIRKKERWQWEEWLHEFYGP
jgi:threonine aldolase